MVILKSLFHVMCALFLQIAIIYTGIFNYVSVDCGYKYYAEAAYSTKHTSLYPWFPMPLNAISNIGYPVVGLIWIFRLHRNNFMVKNNYSLNKLLNTMETAKYKQVTYYLHVFLWMAIVYGPLQLFRIITQKHNAAVIDQWVTLPFFSVMILLLVLLEHHLSFLICSLVCIVSFSSYFVTVVTETGFEIALSVHILLATFFCLLKQRNLGDKDSLLYFLLTFLCCLGFVLLKLYDFQLSSFDMFKTFTGHFWSKVCDFLQIHFCLCFYFSLIQNKSLKLK